MRPQRLGAALCCLLCGCVADVPPELDYRIRFEPDGEEPALEVTLVFTGSEDGHTALRLPSRWAGHQDLYGAIRDLRSRTFGTEVQRTSDPALLEVHHEPGVEVMIQYRIVQDWEGPVERDTYHRAIVQREYFHVVGHTMLVHPELPWEEEVVAGFNWSGPVSARFASSLGGDAKQETVVTLGDLVRTVFVGGDYRVHRLEVAERPVHLALRGEWPYEDRELQALLQEIFSVERGFWNDFDYPYYLVTVSPFAEGVGGTGLTNSFAAFADPRLGLDEGYTYLLTHELFHHWNGGRIRAESSPERQYWFTEGLTDFYTYELLRRGGVYDDARYVEELNEALEEFHRSEVRTVSREVVEERYWTDADVRRVPYLRGHLLGLWLNGRILDASGRRRSLDHVMYEVLERSVAGEPLTDELVRRVLSKHVDREDVERLYRVLDEGEPVPLEVGAIAECWTSEVVEQPVFALGFDYPSTRERRRLTGVDSGGPAHRAGIREGMALRRWSVRFGAPEQEVTLVVVDDGGEERQVSYLPAGQTTIPIPRILGGSECRPRQSSTAP